MRASIYLRWFGVLSYLTIIPVVVGQDDWVSETAQPGSPSSAIESISDNQTTLQAFLQEQEALVQYWMELIDKGATEEQVAAWQNRNSTFFAEQQQRAQVMATTSALQSLPVNVTPENPANASESLKEFLTAQTALTNARVQIHNQLVQTMPASANAVQVGQMQQQEEQTFQLRHAGDIQIQEQRAQALAVESAQVPLMVPRPTHIPPGATPQLAAYLTQHDQLLSDEAQLENQYINADPAVRDAAMRQWHQQNAQRIQDVQQLAQNLPPTSATQATLTTER